jgi:hypothetical protein
MPHNVKTRCRDIWWDLVTRLKFKALVRIAAALQVGTGAWLAGDVVEPPAAPLVHLRGGGVGITLDGGGRSETGGGGAGDNGSDGGAAGDLVATTVTVTDAVTPPSPSSSAWGEESFHEVTTPAGTYRFRVVDSGDGLGGATPSLSPVSSGLSRSSTVEPPRPPPPPVVGHRLCLTTHVPKYAPRGCSRLYRGDPTNEQSHSGPGSHVDLACHALKP